MEALINEVLKSGCARENLEIKLFGGANFGGSKVGTNNAEFALRYLANEGLRVIAEDFGGPHGRRIHYHPASGKVGRLLLLGTAEQRAINEEQLYGKALKTRPCPEGSIELFD
jgi:chemotaxis protein CheD